MKRFAVNFKRILEVLCLARFIKKLLTHFLVQKWSGLRWVQTHSGCSPLARFAVKNCGRNFTIYVSKNDAVCCWVQTHLGSFRLARLIKSSGRIFSICASKNKAVCCEVQTHFGRSLPASSTKKVLGAIPRFVRPKMKRFAVKFRRNLEVFAFQAL